LKAGDELAAQRLWESYFQQMVQLARRKLVGAPRAIADEEDVALSAFNSFCNGAREGRFTQLVDRTNLWPLLLAITANKSVDLIRLQNRLRRGGSGGSDRPATQDNTAKKRSAVHLDELISQEPSPEFISQMTDELDFLLRLLDDTQDPDLKTIALLKMDGFRNDEIAKKIGCVRRTIERKLTLISTLWARHSDDGSVT
jgi:DNA-directed RNA polymerase specialized sigma24 family protein